MKRNAWNLTLNIMKSYHLSIPYGMIVFLQIKCNKKVITEQGWCLYNRVLLRNPQIRSTMTNGEKEIEATDNDTIFPSKGVQNVIDIAKTNSKL